MARSLNPTLVASELPTSLEFFSIFLRSHGSTAPCLAPGPYRAPLLRECCGSGASSLGRAGRASLSRVAGLGLAGLALVWLWFGWLFLGFGLISVGFGLISGGLRLIFGLDFSLSVTFLGFLPILASHRLALLSRRS